MAETLAFELQGFLVFANFYWRFIRSFSTLARPLTDLIRGQVKWLKTSPKAAKAFVDLKTTFSNAPVLQQPDKTKPFRRGSRFVFQITFRPEEKNVRAVLSQCTVEGFSTWFIPLKALPTAPIVSMEPPMSDQPAVQMWCQSSEQPVVEGPFSDKEDPSGPPPSPLEMEGSPIRCVPCLTQAGETAWETTWKAGVILGEEGSVTINSHISEACACASGNLPSFVCVRVPTSAVVGQINTLSAGQNGSVVCGRLAY
ncbi:hypothetical protein P4O66_014460 [Electrophorus voltai]|uniref:Uncharacterized protein n=1 Tax=Electrophorus voltai TaxID=2609070 RepID=A0AAD8Z0X7_9TELE|nr:hypothetical protein P4O66_014460 [Electrophorus voltai]